MVTDEWQVTTGLQAMAVARCHETVHACVGHQRNVCCRWSAGLKQKVDHLLAGTARSSGDEHPLLFVRHVSHNVVRTIVARS